MSTSSRKLNTRAAGSSTTVAVPPAQPLHEVSRKRYNNLTMRPSTWYNSMDNIPEKDRPIPQPPSVIKRQVREQLSPKRSGQERETEDDEPGSRTGRATDNDDEGVHNHNNKQKKKTLTPAEYMNRSVPHFRSPRTPTKPINTQLYPQRLSREQILGQSSNSSSSSASNGNIPQNHQEDENEQHEKGGVSPTSASRGRGKYSEEITEKTEALRQRLQADKDYFISRHSFERIKRRTERTIYMRELTAVWSERTDRSPFWVDQRVAMKKSFEKLEQERLLSTGKKRNGRFLIENNGEVEEGEGRDRQGEEEEGSEVNKKHGGSPKTAAQGTSSSTSPVITDGGRTTTTTGSSTNNHSREDNSRMLRRSSPSSSTSTSYISPDSWMPARTARALQKPIVRFYASSEAYKMTPRYPLKSSGIATTKIIPPACAPKHLPWEDSSSEEEGERQAKKGGREVTKQKNKKNKKTRSGPRTQRKGSSLNNKDETAVKEGEEMAEAGGDSSSSVRKEGGEEKAEDQSPEEVGPDGKEEKDDEDAVEKRKADEDSDDDSFEL